MDPRRWNSRSRPESPVGRVHDDNRLYGGQERKVDCNVTFGSLLLAPNNIFDMGGAGFPLPEGILLSGLVVFGLHPIVLLLSVSLLFDPLIDRPTAFAICHIGNLCLYIIFSRGFQETKNHKLPSTKKTLETLYISLFIASI